MPAMPPRFDPISKPVIAGPVPSLKSFAARVVSSHIAALSDIGDVPYSLVAPFLAQCSAVQLGDIELRSPHIRRESRELWKAHTLRDFFEVRIPYEKNEIKEPRNWRKVYIEAHEARQQKEADGRARLKDSYKALEDKRQERKLVYDPRIRGEPKKQSTSGWSSSTSSKSPSNSIMSKVRGQTSHYAKTFKTPVSRPPPRRIPAPANGPSAASTSKRPEPSGIRAAMAGMPTKQPSLSGPATSSSAPKLVLTGKPVVGPPSDLSAKSVPLPSISPHSKSASSSVVPSAALPAFPPSLSYRAPSSASVKPGGSSSFVDMSSRPIDPSERFVISSARPKVADRERAVPRGTYIPATSRDEGTAKIAAVNFFGKPAGGGASRPVSKDVVKVSTRAVVVERPSASSRPGGMSTQQGSPPARPRTGPPPAFSGDLPLSVKTTPEGTLGLASGQDGTETGAGHKRDVGKQNGSTLPPALPKKKESTMFIPAKRRKIVP